jgi:hypothetical protein
LGLTYDLFDVDMHLYGKNGDPSQPFPHYAPFVHMTLATSSHKKYSEIWPQVTEVIKNTDAKCYNEGEFIPVDLELKNPDFDEDAYNRYAPISEKDDVGSDVTFKSALSGEKRKLPADISLRRLDPTKNGPKDRFRAGEMYITLRDDTDPRLMELLCNMGFSAPFIPKLVEGEDEKLMIDESGAPLIVNDIPFTLQVTDMRDVVKVANLVLAMIEEIGGVRDGSLKIEYATHFEILNGVDYHSQVPPVLSYFELRRGLEKQAHVPYLNGAPQLGRTGKQLKDFYRDAKSIAETSIHRDVGSDFDEIIQRTTGLQIS